MQTSRKAQLEQATESADSDEGLVHVGMLRDVMARDTERDTHSEKRAATALYPYCDHGYLDSDQ